MKNEKRESIERERRLRQWAEYLRTVPESIIELLKRPILIGDN